MAKGGMGALLAAMLGAMLLLAGCGAQAEPPRDFDAGGDANRGRQAIVEYGCNACHTVPGITRADATVGPPLTAWAERSTIAGQFPNQPQTLVAWIQNPQAMKPGTIMPNTGISEEDARNVAQYLYTLHANTARLPWP